MRSTVIPAQITTVEDKIAGNFNLTQIILLVVPVFITTILFALVPPIMKLGAAKITVALISLVISLILALRIKDKVVLNWLLIWIKFRFRPSFYVFDKNDDFLRNIEPTPKKINKVKAIKTVKTKDEEPVLMEADTVKLFHIINNQRNSLSFGFNQKGGLNVAVEPGKK